MPASEPIRVLVVDDCAVVRAVLARALGGEADISLIGAAKDAFEARDMIIRHHPQVIILDLNLPRIDGLTFLRKLRTDYPVPVIIFSGAAQANSDAAVGALEAGAIDVIAKPNIGGAAAIAALGRQMSDAIRAAALAHAPRCSTPALRQPTSSSVGIDLQRSVIAIGASTGGTEAIKDVVCNLPRLCPPVVMVLHMPAGFTKSYAGRLNSIGPLAVCEAVEGESLVPGRAFLARGDTHMTIKGRPGAWRISYTDQEPINRHCPSVDVLFDSVALCGGNRAVGVLLTGMGADGARGLLRMRAAGAATIAQDETTSVVFGMPKVAIELNAAQLIRPLGEIPASILRELRSHATLAVGHV